MIKDVIMRKRRTQGQAVDKSKAAGEPLLRRLGFSRQLVAVRRLRDLHLLAVQQSERRVGDNLVGSCQPGPHLDIQTQIVAEGHVLQVDAIARPTVATCIPSARKSSACDGTISRFGAPGTVRWTST